MINGAAHYVDYVSIHNFTYSKDPMQNSTAPYVAEKGIQITTALIDLAFIEHHERLPIPPPSRPKICFNEWNVWDMEGAPGDLGSEQVYTLSDALGVASWLNVFVRNAQHVGIASPAQSVNAISPLHVHSEGVLKHATYPVFWLFANFMQGSSLNIHVCSEKYQGPTTPTWLQHAQAMPFLDVAGTIDHTTQELNVVIVNRHLEPKDLDLQVVASSAHYVPLQRIEVAGEDLCAFNSIESPDIIRAVDCGPFPSSSIRLPKHSVTLLRWKIS